jgi:hypothetical protein
MPPGGIRLRRIWTQWQTLNSLVRQFKPHTIVLLSAGPETLFVARLLVQQYRAIQLFIVMHGNLGAVTGWRSRDPRHRLIDMRSALSASQHPRINLIVLEKHIPAAAMNAGLTNRFLVWLHPTNANEEALSTPWSPPVRLRLVFVGTANRQKGFDQIIKLRRRVPGNYDWALAGTLSADFSRNDLADFDMPSGRLSRTEYLAAVRHADYAILAFGPEYAFTASGSLLDCITQRKPLIAITNSLLEALQTQYGPFGHLCADVEAMVTLLDDPERLRDAVAYAAFQHTLQAMHTDRLPDRLAAKIRSDLGC